MIMEAECATEYKPNKEGKSRSMVEIDKTKKLETSCELYVLEVNGVTSGYTDVPVIKSISISLFPRELVALLGSNGSGKTTMLRTIMGFLPSWEGTIHLGDITLTNLPVYDRVRNGLGMVPSGRKMFAGISVQDNLRMGAYLDHEEKSIQTKLSDVYNLFPDLVKRKHHLAGELSGGEQQMVAIGRAMMAEPKVLLVDELSMGLAPIVVDRLMPSLEKIRDEWEIPILFVEQDVQRGIDLADRVLVLAYGEIVMEGQPKVLMDDRKLIQTFLGL